MGYISFCLFFAPWPLASSPSPFHIAPGVTTLTSRCPHASSCATRLPTSVVVRKPRTSWLHLPSATRYRILNRLFPIPVAFRTSTHSTFFCHIHSRHTLNRYSHVPSPPALSPPPTRSETQRLKTPRLPTAHRISRKLRLHGRHDVRRSDPIDRNGPGGC